MFSFPKRTGTVQRFARHCEHGLIALAIAIAIALAIVRSASLAGTRASISGA